jgi:DNA-binding NtrC family response regulator
MAELLNSSLRDEGIKMAYLMNLDNHAEHHELTDIFLIGNDPRCNLRIEGDLSPERQSRIESKDGAYLIRDLRSGYATRVNGHLITDLILENEDQIFVGGRTYVFLTELPTETSLGMKSKNESWAQQLKMLGSVAGTDHPVLILGPSGTGKEVLAEALHKNSKRRDGPFVSVNCSALTETLIESELFGHLKGSFTGAIADRKGAFEAARGGTLFLDEIGDLPYCLQAKLLRALENNEIRPVGCDKNIRTDVRIVAATHQNLLEKIANKEFRSDLYFRLNVVTANIPSLKSRMEDFEIILMEFAKKYRVRFTMGAIIKMRNHIWPGNIRELKNTVARASAFFPRLSIDETHVDHIIDKMTILPGFAGVPSTGAELQKKALPVMKEVERQMIVKRLIANQGNQRLTANELGIPKSTLHDRLKTYQINPKDFNARALRDSKVLERLSL